MSVSSLFYDVPRETIDQIDRYVQLLHKWNTKINLTSRRLTVWQFWRQIGDAIFLSHLLKNEKIIDIGSGNGLPGVILAICGYENLILVEKNLKKVAFLNKIKIELGLRYNVVHSDVKEVQQTCDVITSKAVASCQEIMKLCQHLLHENTKVFLLKSNHQIGELDSLNKDWSFKINLHKNKYNSSMIFELYDLYRKERFEKSNCNS